MMKKVNLSQVIVAPFQRVSLIVWCCAPGAVLTAMSESLAKTDPLFRALNDLQPTLAKVNQPLISALITIFGDFREKILTDFQTKMDSSFAELKSDYMSFLQTKDAKINELENSCNYLRKTVESLEDKMDAVEAYSRRDTVIISGAVPAVTPNENIKDVVVELVTAKLGSNIQIQSKDISVAHRLQSKNPTTRGTQRHPNIYVKLVRRDLKKELIVASKTQNKAAPNKIFLNESLTPQRPPCSKLLLNSRKIMVTTSSRA